VSEVQGGGRLGYLVPEFPGQTHAFFWREFCALRQLGLDPVLLSTRPPQDGEGGHAFTREAAAQTRYLVPPSPGAIAWLLAHPKAWANARAYLRGLSPRGLKSSLSRQAFLLCAVRLKRLADREGITHLHVHSCSNAAHLAALCRRLGGPTFGLTLHGDLEVYGTDHPQKTAEAAYVTAVTRPLREQLIEIADVMEERVPVIWMGVDTDRFTPPESPPKSSPESSPESPRPDGPTRLITVARLHPCKGHVHALRAMKAAVDRGADLVYDIAGKGPAEASLQSEIEQLGLGDRVNLLGSIGEESVLERLRNSDVFVLPSVGLGEAAPVSVMEAMACGRPVVCSIIGGTRDMIDHGRDSYLIEQGDEAGLADAFVELAHDPDRRRRIGAAARERAVRQFDYRAQARRLHEWITWAQHPQSQPPAVMPVTTPTEPSAEHASDLPGVPGSELPGSGSELPGSGSELPGGVTA
jgi:glycosyltransferase involved in cell wall biosynthesis